MQFPPTHMEFLPTKTIELISPLNPIEVVLKLTSVIHAEDENLSSFTKDGKFYGVVGATSFSIHRHKPNCRDCLPIANGTIKPSASGSRIRVKMTMNAFGIMLTLGWLIMAALIFLVLAIAMLSGNAGYKVLCLPLLVVLFAFAWPRLISFYPETEIAKKFLCETLKARDSMTGMSGTKK